MFQTNINQLLRGFANDFTIGFMNLISSKCSQQFYLAIIFIMMFGWGLKKSFIVTDLSIKVPTLPAVSY